MPDLSILNATTKTCISFQQASADFYARARDAMGRDCSPPRVCDHQWSAANFALEARIRLDRINGHA